TTRRYLLSSYVPDEGKESVDSVLGGAERLAEEQHLRSGVHQVFAPDDVGDRHVDVVDRVGEEEHRHAVRTDDDEVLEVTVLELDASADDVVPAGDALVGGAEPDDDTRSGLHVSVAAVAVVAGRAARRLVARLHRLLRAVA